MNCAGYMAGDDRWNMHADNDFDMGHISNRLE